MEDLKPVIARNIAALRQNAGMTQLELAEALHYSDKAVSKWERGESIPDVMVLKQISDLFHVSVDSLLRHEAPVQQTAMRAEYLRVRRIITAIALVGVAAAALVAFIVLRLWLVFLYALPTVAVVLLVLNSLWFNPRHNYAVISALMWTLLLAACATLQHAQIPMWELMLVGLPGQVIIWLCSRFHKEK